ncbi:kinase-like protein [Obba rivulosa]|uniref:Kinase-like protein n=1 Tax=Obba rivulosa TaxID=1052685 RepID=A0A8E2DPE0_9APHY|nr:kinase-like protein [Obba rivulosa]
MLKKICEKHYVLPQSLLLPPKSVRTDRGRPEAIGGFAPVYKGAYGTCSVALKVFRVRDDDNVPEGVHRSFYTEAILWKHLRHTNITPFHGVDNSLFSMALVSEWQPFGTVIDYLTTHPSADRLRLMIDVAEGLDYLHGSHIVHGDLKGNNILVNIRHGAVLADFGLAGLDPEFVHPTRSVTEGSIPWMAPEIIDPENVELHSAWYTTQSDVYSFSLTMWEMFTCQVPFYGTNNIHKLTCLIVDGARPQRPLQAKAAGLSDDMWNLIEMCWQKDRTKRPNIPYVLEALKQAHGDFASTNLI